MSKGSHKLTINNTGVSYPEQGAKIFDERPLDDRQIDGKVVYNDNILTQGENTIRKPYAACSECHDSQDSQNTTNGLNSLVQELTNVLKSSDDSIKSVDNIDSEMDTIVIENEAKEPGENS